MLDKLKVVWYNILVNQRKVGKANGKICKL